VGDEIIWDLAVATLLMWLGQHARIKPWGLFALYVAGYSAFHIFEESLRIDSSQYFLGLRLNMYIAIAGTVGGLIWFGLAQRRTGRPVVMLTGTVNPAQGMRTAPRSHPHPFGRIRRDGTLSRQPERQGPEHRAGNPHEPDWMRIECRQAQTRELALSCCRNGSSAHCPGT
jgi:hypothetical protein